MPCNWKFAAENFAGDGYHFPTTHASATKVRGEDPGAARRGGGFSANPGNGHGILVQAVSDPRLPVSGREKDVGSDLLTKYIKEISAEMSSRLGARAQKIAPNIGTIFPNLSYLWMRPQLLQFHPRGPEKTEAWAWCIVDKAAPPEAKNAMRLSMLRGAGPSGIVEQDDLENWSMCTASSRGPIARNHPFNYQLGIGRERYSEEFPGSLNSSPSEHNQRALYAHWAELMMKP